jgi:BolA protein
MTYCDRITAKLVDAFRPSRLEVIDESARHAGHNAAAATLGETHFRVRITAAAFAGMSRLERHRRINELLKAELAERVHALAIEADAPPA